MVTLFDNVVNSFEQLIKPLCLLLFVFVINVVIHYCREKTKEKYFFDDTKFWKKYVIAHGMACIFSLVFLCIFYFLPREGSGVLAFSVLAVFYGFLIKIIMTQNEDNGGHIEEWGDASGSIMYIMSTLSPIIFVVIHLLLCSVCLYFIREKMIAGNGKYQ